MVCHHVTAAVLLMLLLFTATAHPAYCHDNGQFLATQIQPAAVPTYKDENVQLTSAASEAWKLGGRVAKKIWSRSRPPSNPVHLPPKKTNPPVQPNRLHTLCPECDRVTVNAMRQLGKYFDDDLEQIARKIGFPVNDAWLEVPVVRKMEAMLMAADDMDSVMVLLVRNRAEKYESILFDDVLKGYISRHPEEPVKFSRWEKSAARLDGPADEWQSALAAGGEQRVPEEYEAAIRAVSKYCDHPCAPLNGMLGVLEDDLGLVPKVAYNIVATSPSQEIAMLRALKHVPEEEWGPRLRRAFAVLEEYEGMSGVPEFRLFMLTKRAYQGSPAPHYTRGALSP